MARGPSPTCAQSAQESYENARVDAALVGSALRVEPAPEGKRIAFVRIVRHDVFVEDEPYPLLLNAVHWRTTERFVRGELLLEVGERYRDAAAQESERNLRERGYFAYVRVVPVVAAPGEVGVLVLTRDRWSLRPEPDYSAGNGGLDYVQLELVERNLFGTGRRAVARIRWTPYTWELGERYSDQRLLDEELALRQKLDVIVNHQTDEVEGWRGELGIRRPFYTLADRWGADASVKYADEVTRRIDGGEVRPVRDAAQARTGLRHAFDDRTLEAELSGSYRRGERYKQTVTLGGAMATRDTAFNDETCDPETTPERCDRAKQPFEDVVLPAKRRDVYPFVRHQLFLPRHRRFQHLTTLGLTETVRVGPELDVRFGLPLRALGSVENAFAARSASGYVWAEHDALLEARVVGEARARLDERETGDRDEAAVVDRLLSGLLRVASPVLWVGRAVLSARWDARRDDTQKTDVTLGDRGGLRGYAGEADQSPTLASPGSSLVLGNLELRSVPLDLRSIQLGAVLFYDVGSVYSKLSELDAHHAAGAGLRLVLPQVDPIVFRFDFGVPLDGARGLAVRFSGGLGQGVKLVQGEP